MDKKQQRSHSLPETTLSEEVQLVRPPDGGWGWAVVLGSFLCNVVVDGIIFSYGLLLPELSKDLKVGKGRLAWVGSLLAGFYLIAGPVVSGFANTYGCRPVTIVGTVIASASFALASLANNVEFLCLTFGVCGGIGFGFIYLPAVVTVGYYFEKKRAFATGLAVCGSGVGTFLMAPFVQYLLGRYDWRGTMLVLSGVVLNCACFGALFRPLRTPPPHSLEEKPPLLQRIKMYRDARRGSMDVVRNESVPHFSLSLPEISSTTPELMVDALISNSKNSPPPSYSEVVGADEEEMFSFLRPPPGDHYEKYSPLPSIVPAKPKRSRYTAARTDFSRPFYRQDILYSASLLHLPEFKKSHQNIEEYAASVTKIPDNPESGSSCLSPAMRDTFRQMLDFSLLRSPTFILLGVGGFLTLAGFFVPFMFVVDRAVEQGISIETATYILPTIGLTNTIGRIFCGWISDRPSLNALSINNGALIVGGFVTALSSCFTSIESMLVYGGIFGFAIGCFATLRSIVIVELLGLEKLTNAFGLLLLFQGLASIIGAPVAALLGLSVIRKRRLRRRQMWQRKWLQRRETLGCFENLMRELALEDTEAYRRWLRMDVSVFEELVALVSPYIEKKNTVMRKAIPAAERIALTLRFLATGETQSSLSYQFRIAQNTISGIIPAVCAAICQCLPIQVPRTEEDWKQISQDFWEKWNYPLCLGAVDGKHVKIQPPPNSGATYRNYKGFFSVVLLALVDANLKFLFVDVGTNGRTSDGGVWDKSKIKKAFEEGALHIPEADALPGTRVKVPYVIVADDAFPLQPHIMKPYQGRNLSRDQLIHNYRLSRARRVSENAFGILASRFRIFGVPIASSPAKCQKIVMAACCLQNFLIEKSLQAYLPEGSLDEEDVEKGVTREGSWRQTPTLLQPCERSLSRGTQEAKHVRDKFCNYFNAEGAVHWQNKYYAFH